jgi:hypothetical protein
MPFIKQSPKKSGTTYPGVSAAKLKGLGERPGRYQSGGSACVTLKDNDIPRRRKPEMRKR